MLHPNIRLLTMAAVLLAVLGLAYVGYRARENAAMERAQAEAEATKKNEKLLWQEPDRRIEREEEAKRRALECGRNATVVRGRSMIRRERQGLPSGRRLRALNEPFDALQ